MTARVEAFDPREGGAYRIVLTYDHPAPGKTTADSDVVSGRFLQLLPNQRIVQAVGFASDDPSFAGEMTITWELSAVPQGANVTIRAENVPPGITEADHQAGFQSTLENFARFVESGASSRSPQD